MSYNLVDPTTGDLTRVAGGTLYADSPIGTISPFGGSAIPSGYLLCNGAEVLKTAYAELYAVIGDAFGTASDNTKFKLPDLRGRATMGVASGHALGASENDATAVKGLSVTTTVNSKTLEGSFKPYSPSGAGGDYSSVGNMTVSGIFGKGTASTTGYVPAVTATVGKSYPLTVDASHKHTASSTLSSTDTETRPKNVRVNYIIKAKQVAVPTDFMSKVDEIYGALIPSNASASNKLITVADRASFTKTISTTAKTQSDWYVLGSIDVSDIPAGNYLVSLQSSPNVQSQSVSCLLQVRSQMVAASMLGGTTQMLSCPKVISRGSATTLTVSFYLGYAATIEAGDFVIRFDRVN